MKPGTQSDGETRHLTPRVVIGYEDLDSGIRAMDMYKRVLESIIGSCELKIWKFEPLGLPELLAEAISDVAAADVLIISVAGDRPLPLEAVEWVEACAELANPQAAILFVTHPDKQDQPAAALASTYLKDVAQKRSASYFTHTPLAARTGPRDNICGFQNRTVGHAVLHSDRHDRWGLNE